MRGHVAGALGESLSRKADFYAPAAQRFRADGEALGEVIARTNLRGIKVAVGDRAGADEEVERALQVAQASGLPEVVVRASVLEASHLTELGKNLGRAHRTLLRAEAAVFPNGPEGLQQSVLVHLSNLSFALGRYDEAIDRLGRLLERTETFGNVHEVPMLRFNIVNARRAQREERPVAGSLEELQGLAQAALRSSEEQDATAIAVRTRALLADLSSLADPERTRELDRRCLEGSRRLEERLPEMECLWSMAKHLAPRDPRAASAALDRAARIALAERNDMFEAFVWQARLRTAWDIRPPSEAALEALQALDAVERLRAAQADTQARIEVLVSWTKDYYWLAGQLLSAAPPNLDLAFSVMERMRARVLLEALEVAGIDPVPSAGNDLTAETRARIVAVQRRLLAPAIDSEHRSALLQELRRLELDEADLREEVEATRTAGGLGRPRLAMLEQVRSQLHPDEMMLMFLTGLDEDLYGGFGGGSWLLAISPAGVVVRKIPDRLRLEAMVPIFAGLVARRDGTERSAAAALHRELLGGDQRVIGPMVRKLAIVADGILHELPFAALRVAPEKAPLGALYEIAVVPSATLWTRWRSTAGTRVPAAVLVVADPSPEISSSGQPSAERDAALAQGLAVGPLPHARREGHRVRRTIGGLSRVLAGGEATEAILKSIPLAPFGILHFATHAIADEAYPERSAVLLKAGSAAEDGLLQPREVSVLNLESRMVVLSACSTAAGPVASGEGVLNLARSFFEAGARTIVASRWRLRDDEAETLFGWFYEYVGRGETMAEALRLARERAVADGIPAATWAGVELLGDPDLRLAVRAPTRWPTVPRLVFGVAILGLLAWSLRAMARRARLRPPPVS